MACSFRDNRTSHFLRTRHIHTVALWAKTHCSEFLDGSVNRCSFRTPITLFRGLVGLALRPLARHRWVYLLLDGR